MLAGVFLLRERILKDSRWSVYAYSAFAVILAYLSWSVKKPGRSYVFVWAEEIPSGVRALTLFDFGNALWIGAILPLVMLRVAWARSTGEQYNPLGTPVWSSPLVLLVLIPPAVFVILNSAITGSFAFLDSLPLVWQIRKAASILVLTATYEEVVFRVVSIMSLQAALPRTLPDSQIAVVAGIGSSILFGFAHAEQGMVAIVGAALSGVLFACVSLRLRNLEACILGHWLLALLGVRWN